jgi:hypothetical protein
VLELPRMTAVHTKEVELDGLDRVLFADHLRVLRPGLGIRAHCRHNPAHTRAFSLGGAAKGLHVSDFDLAPLFLGHPRASLDDERGERDVDSLCMRCNRLQSVHVDNQFGDLGDTERVRLAARHHHHFLAQRVLDQKLYDASAHIPPMAEQCASAAAATDLPPSSSFTSECKKPVLIGPLFLYTRRVSFDLPLRVTPDAFGAAAQINDAASGRNVLRSSSRRELFE